MSPFPSLFGVFLFLLLALGARGADSFRTDINPALLYYQAFALAPVLSEDDSQYLSVTEWRGRPFDSRIESLLGMYGKQFRLLHQAAQSKVPCDWGIDFSPGPDTLLPGLAKAKALAQTARLRARWHLEHGRQEEARDDLLGAFVLGRNVSRDGVLISALVQFAMENIVASVVAENYFRFAPETLSQLVDGFDRAPARGTVQQTLAVEKTWFFDWYFRKLHQFQAETPGDDAEIMKKARALIARTFIEGEQEDAGFADRAMAASGGTSAGLESRLRDLLPLYAELTALMGLPFEEFGPASKALSEKLERDPNPFVTKLLPAILKSRAKEFRIEVKMETVRAAVAYRLKGEEGFRQVLDPTSHEPFRLDRLNVQGEDVGFVLKSKLNTLGFDESLAFAEKDGPPFYVDGKNAGKPLPAEARRP